MPETLLEFAGDLPVAKGARTVQRQFLTMVLRQHGKRLSGVLLQVCSRSYFEILAF